VNFQVRRTPRNAIHRSWLFSIIEKILLLLTLALADKNGALGRLPSYLRDPEASRFAVIEAFIGAFICTREKNDNTGNGEATSFDAHILSRGYELTIRIALSVIFSCPK
jgi:hypothetical protein